MSRSLVRTCAALALSLSSAVAVADTHVSLTPEHPPAWRASRLLDSLRDGARAARELRVDTTPRGARVELAYVRDGAELARASGTAPLVALLPSRAHSGEEDRIVVRAALAGFAPAELVLGAREAEPVVHLSLASPPSALLAVSLLQLAGRTRITLLAERALTARLTETQRGWRLVLANVAISARLGARLEALRGGPIERITVRGVGDDWILDLVRAPGEVRPARLTRREEPVRGVGHLALEWLGNGRAEASLAAARAVLADLPADVTDACSSAFEDAVTAALGPDVLARSLAPGGGFTDAYTMAALERIALVSPSGLLLRDGSRALLDTPLARASAALRAGEVRGALVAIRALAEGLAPAGAGQGTLHAWLAPEAALEDFAAILDRAASAEARCREGG